MSLSTVSAVATIEGAYCLAFTVRLKFQDSHALLSFENLCRSLFDPHSSTEVFENLSRAVDQRKLSSIIERVCLFPRFGRGRCE